MSQVEMYDCLDGRQTLIDGLLDGKGSVELVDVSPRLCPKGYTPEYLMVRGARTSFGLGLKDPITDSKLLRYLLVNYHTSPIELANATFRVVCPKAVAIHFLRHRTGHFNEFSQRYAEVPETQNFYNPLEYEHGVREGTKLNKQSSSDITDPAKKQALNETLEKANELLRQTHELYHTLVSQGLAKEIARFYLPMSEYTTLYIQMDLNNLSKMFMLRCDDHTQHETVVFARAMMQLVEPLFPVCMQVLRERMNGMSLLESELAVLRGEKDLQELVSISEKKALQEKAEQLRVTLLKSKDAKSESR